MKLKNKNNSLVSVVLTTFQRNRLLLKAISSVLNQTYKDIQLIVIVDNPKFELNLNEIFNDERLEVIINPINYGVQRSRNIGISNCQGEFYMNLDDDDYYDPQRIELLLKLYCTQKRFKGISLVSSRYIKLLNNKKRYRVKSPKVVKLNKLLYSNKIGNSIFTELAKVISVGGWDEGLCSAQDYDLWLRLVDTYGPALISDKYLMYVNSDTDVKRITTSKLVLSGYEDNFHKHLSKMSIHHQNYNKIKLRLLNGEKIDLLGILRNTPYHLVPFELRRYLNRGSSK